MATHTVDHRTEDVEGINLRWVVTCSCGWSWTHVFPNTMAETGKASYAAEKAAKHHLAMYQTQTHDTWVSAAPGTSWAHGGPATYTIGCACGWKVSGEIPEGTDMDALRRTFRAFGNEHRKLSGVAEDSGTHLDWDESRPAVHNTYASLQPSGWSGVLRYTVGCSCGWKETDVISIGRGPEAIRDTLRGVADEHRTAEGVPADSGTHADWVTGPGYNLETPDAVLSVRPSVPAQSHGQWGPSWTVLPDKPDAGHCALGDTVPGGDGQSGGTWRTVCTCGWTKSGRYNMIPEQEALSLAMYHATEHERGAGIEFGVEGHTS